MLPCCLQALRRAGTGPKLWDSRVAETRSKEPDCRGLFETVIRFFVYDGLQQEVQHVSLTEGPQARPNKVKVEGKAVQERRLGIENGCLL